METESRAQAQAGPGRAVALRPAPGTLLPTPAAELLFEGPVPSLPSLARPYPRGHSSQV